MARTKFKCYFILLISFIWSIDTRSVPISQSSVDNTNGKYLNVDKLLEDRDNSNLKEETKTEKENTINDKIKTSSELLIRNSNVRPGQNVRSYTVAITRNGANFNGIATLDVNLSLDTSENPLRFNVFGLTIQSVKVGVLTDANAIDTVFRVNDNVLIIDPTQTGTRFIVIVEYTAALRNDGTGLYLGQYNGGDYIAMNLHPTNARQVFPCMDEPSMRSIITFSFNNMEYETMVSNSRLQVDSETSFRGLETPTHAWGMVAHSLVSITLPVPNVILYGRQGVSNQDAPAAAAISHYFTALNEWTQAPFFQINNEQDSRLHIMAVPDVNKDWYSLSTICIWEPYIFMPANHAVKQRKIALVTIAEAMARQWFGYVIYPENWRHQWVITGLGSYVAYDIVKNFQTTTNEDDDDNMLDVDTLFTTDVIQEGLLHDAYSIYDPLILPNNIFVNNAIRFHINGLVKYKAAAIMRMLRLVLGDDQEDVVQVATRSLIAGNHLEEITTQSFYNAINSAFSGNTLLTSAKVQSFINNWISNAGYPIIRVTLRPGGVQVTQEHFGFTRPIGTLNFQIPITCTKSSNPDFDNLFPSEIMHVSTMVTVDLDEHEWIIFNLQGQGYYRVNYDDTLWARIIDALSDKEEREEIHPLNRAAILDDALNLARAGRLDYSTAFEIVLTMQLETDYAVWKAFVRNMEFIRSRLIAFATNNEDRDNDIYTRLIGRIIGAVEEEIGFDPGNSADSAMTSLTRGLVMEHACLAGYEPCIAAAIDLFYNPTNVEEVNPNIPIEIRPAVYCTMVREGDGEARTALINRLDLEQSSYERLVILESLACSNDAGFINGLLADTVAANSPYVMEERSKIFTAVATSSFGNTNRALNFLRQRTNDIRNMYGGPEKLDEVILLMAENAVTGRLGDDFTTWVNSQPSINNLLDSNFMASRGRSLIVENLRWNNAYLSEVYEWIAENDAPTQLVSVTLLCISAIVTLFNI